MRQTLLNIRQRLNMSEMQMWAFEIFGPGAWEDIPGDTGSLKWANMVQKAEQQGLLEELADAIQRRRSDIDFDEYMEE
jgi:hypothetical protein